MEKRNLENHSFLLILLFVMGFALPASPVWSLPSHPLAQGSSTSILEIANNKPKPRQKKNKGKRASAQRKHIIERITRSWQRKSLEATKRQILESKPADRVNFKFLKDGLIAHEGHSRQPGGHTIQRHVGLSNKGLKDRYAHDKSLIAKKGPKKGQKTTDYISTFRSLKEVVPLVRTGLRQS